MMTFAFDGPHSGGNDVLADLNVNRLTTAQLEQLHKRTGKPYNTFRLLSEMDVTDGQTHELPSQVVEAG
jgi:ABC-type ATPase involved in cell division